MIEGDGVALYARVSSDGQARDNTMPVRSRRSGRASRPTASSSCRTTPMWMKVIAERFASSGAGKVRDAVAGGIVTRIYIHAPDRLARRYAHQVLLIEEFHRAGAEVIFLNRSIGGTAEDDLLLQVQGVMRNTSERRFWSAAGGGADMPRVPGRSAR